MMLMSDFLPEQSCGLGLVMMQSSLSALSQVVASGCTVATVW